MIRSFLICPDRGMSEGFRQALAPFARLEFIRVLDTYPSSTELIRSLRVSAAEALFISMESIEDGVALAKEVRQEFPHLPTVAIHKSWDPAVLREALRLGIRDVLAEPFERKVLTDALNVLTDLVQHARKDHAITEQLFSFLPSKAGVGTSTIALNTSAAMANLPGQSVLLADFDLNSGMTRFMLNLKNSYSVIDAIESSSKMDEHIWADLVNTQGNLDVLHAGRIRPNYRIEPTQITEVVKFMRRNYRTVCFDFSGNLERYSVELMLESKQILMPVTAEIPSLHVAREKLTFLKEFDLAARTVAVLNRVTRNPVISLNQVEELLGIPVIHSFPNDYLGVSKALTKGSALPLDSSTGRSFLEFAGKLLKTTVPQSKAKVA